MAAGREPPPALSPEGLPPAPDAEAPVAEAPLDAAEAAADAAMIARVDGYLAWAATYTPPGWRWTVSCHEAGHLAAEKILKRPRSIGAYVTDRQGGAYVGTGGCDGFLDAMVLAAGRAAERLAAETPPPPDMAPPDKVESLRALSPETFAEMEREDRHAVQDDVQLARWAIRGIESEPTRWEPLVRWVRREAERFVANNAGFIIRVAQHLYVHGFIGSEDVETALHPAGHSTTQGV